MAWLFACLDPAEEGLQGLVQPVQPVQPVQRILHHVRMDVALLGPLLLDAWPLRRLHGKGHGNVALLPGGFPLLKAGVIAVAAAPQDRLHRPFLHRRWHQLVLVGFAHTLLLHAHLFCPIGARSATRGTRGTIVALVGHAAFIPMPKGRGPQPGFWLPLEKSENVLLPVAVCAGASVPSALQV